MIASLLVRSCTTARRTLSLVLDYEADVAEIEAFAAHLGRCAACRRYTAEVSSFTRHLRRAGGSADVSRHNQEGS